MKSNQNKKQIYQKKQGKNLKKNNQTINKTKKNKVVLVFDENERDDYLKGKYGAKIKRNKAHKKKQEEIQKQLLREERRKMREIKSKDSQRYKEIIKQNNEILQQISNQNKSKKQMEILKSADDNEFVIETQFL